jgi:N-acetyl-anhydromuramyl-L-alanine amidase AmpD
VGRLLLLVSIAACSASSSEPAPAKTAPPPDAGVELVIVDAAAPAPSTAIVDAPMKWSAERERLTLEYRRAHSDAAATDLAIAPKVIILHYTAGGSAKSTRSYFDNLRLEASRAGLARGGAVNVSAHFIVDRDGTIYRLQPETRFARHCIGMNHLAIGVENVGDERRWPLTDAQVRANVALVRDLASRFPITHLLGHHEVMGFRKHAYFVELDPTYRNDKGDPGAAFMAKVRARLGDLALAGAEK